MSLGEIDRLDPTSRRVKLLPLSGWDWDPRLGFPLEIVCAIQLIGHSFAARILHAVGADII